MPFLIDATDASGVGETRAVLRASHLKRLEDSLELIIAAGAKLTDDGAAIGSLFLLEVDSREEAEQFVAHDPYLIGGVYESVIITRWRKGFFDHARVLQSVVR